MTDIEIARSIKLKPITDIAGKLGIDTEEIELFGKYKAKLPLNLIRPGKMENKNLILVSLLRPVHAGREAILRKC